MTQDPNNNMCYGTVVTGDRVIADPSGAIKGGIAGGKAGGVGIAIGTTVGAVC